MISCIVAVSENFVIGNRGIIPWRIKGEQKRFKELTTGKTIIMGRKSFEEIGKPLPNRKTIVISNTLSFKENNCITVSSLTEALRISQNEEEVFIAGGGSVYAEAMPLVNRIYLTIIHKEVIGDTYFPRINHDLYDLIYEEKIEGEISYTYYTYEKKV
jgi:dihydrofolate reductase/dihydrofolate reductase (trimethoprim resistance protein)